MENVVIMKVLQSLEKLVANQPLILLILQQFVIVYDLFQLQLVLHHYLELFFVCHDLVRGE